MSLFFANAAQIVLCFIAAILVLRYLERPLRELLDQLLGLPSATTFFVRVLGTCLALIAIRSAVNLIDKNTDAMTMVWTLMDHWSDALEPIYIVLLVFAGLVTIILSVLGGRQIHRS
jgi:predicted tellurium resistance membrane protein TerC